MAWTVEHVDDFTPNWWTDVFLGFLTDGTCCICWRQDGDIYEATRALGATEWSIGVILSHAEILENDPGDAYYWHYAARGSTRALAYGTQRVSGHFDGGYPEYPPFNWIPGSFAQLWLGTNTGGGWSFNVLHTYTEDVEYGFIHPPNGGWDIVSQIFEIGGVGVAIASDGTVGVFTTISQNGDLRTLFEDTNYYQAEFWSGGLTVIEHTDLPPATGAYAYNWGGDTCIVDSSDKFHVLWDDADPNLNGWPYEVKYAQVDGSPQIIYSDPNVGGYPAGLTVDAADNVFAFYRLEYDSSVCVPIGGSGEALDIYDNVSGAVKGTGLNIAASNSYESHLIYLTRTSGGTWVQEDIVSRTVYLCEMSIYNNTLYVAFTDENGVWLAKQGGRAPFWMIF
jgi:hypothetical protein